MMLKQLDIHRQNHISTHTFYNYIYKTHLNLTVYKKLKKKKLKLTVDWNTKCKITKLSGERQQTGDYLHGIRLGKN